MITVKLYGLLRLDTGLKELTLEAGSVRQVLDLLAKKTGMDPKSLNGCVVLVDGKPGNKRTKLKGSEEIALFSPVCGG